MNYTHWLNSKENVVYFKPLPSQNTEYNLPSDFILTRNDAVGGTWILQDIRSGFQFLSINSKEFATICAVLKRIENHELINIIVNPKSRALTVKLPRYNLKFNLIRQNLHSVEYQDFKISRDQHIGTLVGIQQGILLDNGVSSNNLDIFQRRMLIIPHGSIEVQKAAGSLHHQHVEISLDNLQQPPFFSYEFDEELRRLKADKSKAAWLYLAALHATTSSSLPDIFTGVTGTEMAVWILQSALVCSCSPYDKESLAILKHIKDMSPAREYYGTEMRSNEPNMEIEVTYWPTGLPSLTAFDGFTFIVDQLISDSNNLAALFPDMPRSSNTESSTSTQRLQIRAYHRSLSLYNQNVAVKPDFFQNYMKSHVDPAKVEIPELRLKLHYDQLLEVSKGLYCFDKMKFPLSDKKCGLESYLITFKPLAASDPFKNLHIMSLSELLGFDFRGNWLRLYGHCLSQRKKDATSQIEKFEEKQAWKILLANVSYCDPSRVEQIMNIHYIASNAQDFPEPPPDHYGNPSANDFVGKEVETILMNNSHSFTSWNEYHRKICSLAHSDSSSRRYAYGKQQCCSTHEEEHKKYNEKKSQFELELRKDVEGIITAIKQDWPCQAVQNDKEYLFQSPKLNNEAALAGVNKQLSFWHKNHELLLFVQNVEEKLNMSLSRNFGTDERLKPSEEFINQFGQLRKITIPIHIVSDQPPTIDLEAHLGVLFQKHLGVLFRNRDFFADAKQVYSTGCIDNSGQGVNWNEVESCAKLIANLKDLIDTKLQDNISKRIIFQTGICPRTNPLSLLPYLMKDEHDTRSQLEWITGALAVLWSHVKRHKRSITLNSKGEAMSVELKREWENKGYQNWSPAEHPDWLLLELELDLMIRPVQVDVAMQMMKMPDGKNGVMQLNMGEGKTSLLVPLLCSTLANKTTLCRVTVLQSIFKTNLKILSFAIGGLLNRRVYTFPCRRDMEIGTSCLQSINAAYSDCLNKKGVVLTLPEHRLSFRLKICDQIVRGNVDLGLKFLKTENWLRKYARDILDESDELLSVKYQLVYTIGTQVPIDGGDVRWKTCQKILKIVMDIANELYEKFGSSVVEYNPIEESPEKFIHFRLINSACRDEFYDSVAEHFLREVKLPSEHKKCVKLFLTSSSIEQKVHSSVMTIFKDNPDLLSKILLVSGYICRGILELALSKRWRVEYGVDPKGQRRMAVPFRAKDVAAERTEFGHPDLAIILTHLSYYYSGLSDDELLECFNCLKAKVGPDMIYSSWIQTIPKEKVPKFLLTYQGVNIRDPYHCSRLFNLFQKNKPVIDFWLSEKVFPRESKQFPGKIVMTAWDLCYERYQHPVCGFAGTNDSSILLPLQISQQDLPVLLDTNRKLENTLLQPNNCNHKGFQMGVSCREILEEMRKDGLQVLIDSGAMMLQCEQNEQVAKLWLEIDSEIEAVVYFSQDNDMLVKCRSENVQSKVQDLPLELSPYRNSLGKCGVFLDDQHSRGTDLKFPTGFKACVTVGTRMRRDKMAQACMRMRKLAEGDHSVTFYLSNEAYDKVMKLKGSDDDCEPSDLSSRTLETQDVISWVCQNTKEFNADGMLYWTLAGKNYAQKLSAEDSFHYPEHSSPTFDLNNSSVAQAAEILGSKCVDDEVLLLTDMYGIFTESALLVNLIPGWFAFTKDKLTSKNLGKTNVEKVVLETFFSICDRIKQRCLNEVPEKTHVASMLEEEQERELEKEMYLEEERHIVRSKRAAETKLSLHPNVTKMVLHGKEVSQTSGISRLSDVFQCTSFWNEVQPDCWGIEVFATNDFISVIKTPNHWSKTDMHLRPMEYLAAGKNKNGSYQLLVLSPFEVNKLRSSTIPGCSYPFVSL